MELNVILHSLREFHLPVVLRFQKGMQSLGRCKPSLLPPSPHLLYNYLVISSERKCFCILITLCALHIEVCVNTRHPVHMRRSECMRSSSISSQCPWVPFSALLSAQITGTPIRRGLGKPQIYYCIPAGWLHPIVHFSWKEVTLARGKIPQNYTALIPRQTPLPTS